VDNPAAAPRSAPPSEPPVTDPAATVPAGTQPDLTEPLSSAPAGTEPAGSAPAGSEPAGTEPAATTTTVPPSRPTADDIPLLAFAQSFELTLRDLYDEAIGAGVAEGDAGPVFSTLRENHEEYGNVLAGIIGTDAPQRRDDAIFDQFVSGFQNADVVGVASAAYDVESTAVATHNELIGQLTGVDAAATLAALLVIESRHCTVLAHLAGNGEDMAALIENAATALPATAPAEG